MEIQILNQGNISEHINHALHVGMHNICPKSFIRAIPDGVLTKIQRRFHDREIETPSGVTTLSDSQAGSAANMDTRLFARIKKTVDTYVHCSHDWTVQKLCKKIEAEISR